MPTPYLQKIHDEHKVPMSKLEGYWEKAKMIAKKSAKKQHYTTDENGNSFGLVTKIFQNMLGLASDISFESLSRRRHKAHVKPHLTKEEWEAKQAPEKETPAAAEKKSKIVRKDDEATIKKLEADGYKLSGPVQGSAHLLYEKGGEGEKEKEGTKPVEENKPAEKPVEDDDEEVDEDDLDEEDDPKSKKKKKEKAPDWWHKLKYEDQEAYLEDHPRSSFEVTAPREDDSPDHPEWWNDLSRQEQRDYIKKNPKDGYKITAPKEEGDTTEDDPRNLPQMKSVKKVANKIWGKRRAKVAQTLQHHKTGLRAMKTLLTGGEVTGDDWEQAKKTAALTAKLVLGSLFVIGIFAGLAPLAILAGHMFAHEAKSGNLSDFTGFSVSSDGDDTDYHEMALEVADNFYAWVTNQDIPELIKKLKAEKQDD